MKNLVGGPGDDPALAPVRALRRIIPLSESDAEAAAEARLLAELDRKMTEGGRDASD